MIVGGLGLVNEYLEFGKHPDDVDRSSSPSSPQEGDRDIESMKEDINKLKNWIQMLDERVYALEKKIDDRKEE